MHVYSSPSQLIKLFFIHFTKFFIVLQLLFHDTKLSKFFHHRTPSSRLQHHPASVGRRDAIPQPPQTHTYIHTPTHAPTPVSFSYRNGSGSRSPTFPERRTKSATPIYWKVLFARVIFLCMYMWKVLCSGRWFSCWWSIEVDYYERWLVEGDVVGWTAS